MAELLIVPGYLDSEPGHWQSLWQAEFGCPRLQPSSFTEPELDDWLAALDRTVRPGTVLVAHSLGCLATLTWMLRHPGAAGGAFLVAVPDPDQADFPTAITGFSRPAGRLTEPALMVGSRDDPHASWEFTVGLADALGVELVDEGPAGHLSVASGRGPWPRGRRLLADLLASATP